jgi:hypothetical protein
MAKTDTWQHIISICPACDGRREIKVWETEFRCHQCKSVLVPVPYWPDEGKRRVSTDAIEPPGAETEPEIISYLLHALKALGWNVRASVPFRARGPFGRGRCDLVVFNVRREAVRIIEVKDAPEPENAKVSVGDEFFCWYLTDNRKNGLNAELPKYRSHGIPVDYVRGMRRAEQYVEWARRRGTAERLGVDWSLLD